MNRIAPSKDSSLVACIPHYELSCCSGTSCQTDIQASLSGIPELDLDDTFTDDARRLVPKCNPGMTAACSASTTHIGILDDNDGGVFDPPSLMTLTNDLMLILPSYFLFLGLISCMLRFSAARLTLTTHHCVIHCH